MNTSTNEGREVMNNPFTEMIQDAVRAVFDERIKTTDLRAQRLVSPEQAAEYIHQSRSTIYQMLKDGELPVVKSGRSTLIDKDDLDEWIKAHKKYGENARVA